MSTLGTVIRSDRYEGFRGWLGREYPECYVAYALTFDTYRFESIADVILFKLRWSQLSHLEGDGKLIVTLPLSKPAAPNVRAWVAQATPTATHEQEVYSCIAMCVPDDSEGIPLAVDLLDRLGDARDAERLKQVFGLDAICTQQVAA